MEKDNGIKRRLLSIKEMAIYTGLSIHTLYHWVNQGKIPFVKVGKNIKFDIYDIDKFIEERKFTPRI